MADEPLTPLQSRLKAGTFVLTVGVGVALLLYDWGPGNCFSGIRPGIKSVLNRAYGVQPQQNNQAAEQERPVA